MCSSDLVPTWVALDGLDVDPEAVRSDKKVIYEQMIQDELELKPGAAALIEEAADRYRLCVASGSRIESITGCLEKFNLAKHFDAFYSGTDLERSKPYPDVYLHALDSMSLEPGRAVAIEDSAVGLRAARGASLQCVVCPDSSHAGPRQEFDGAACIVDSLNQVDCELLERIAAEGD